MKSLTTTKKYTLQKKLTLAVVSLLFVALGATGVLYALKLGPFSQQTVNDQNTSETDESDTSADTPAVDDPTSASVKNQDDAQDETNTGDSVGLEITAAYVNGDTFSIRALLQTVTESGQCNLSMKNASDGSSYTATAGVQALSSSSTCKGFSVPMSELSSGTWNITVDYKSGERTGTITKEVVINA